MTATAHEQAVAAAAEAMWLTLCRRTDLSGTEGDNLAEAAIEAAAPILYAACEADVRARIVEAIDSANDVNRLHPAWHDGMSFAADIAGGES